MPSTPKWSTKRSSLSQSAKTQDHLLSQLEDSVRTQKPGTSTAAVPVPFKRYEPVELYRRFMATGLDYNGQMSLGYAGAGSSLTLSFTFDFGLLVLPGFIQVPVSITGQAGRIAEQWYFVYRVPQRRLRSGTEAIAWSTDKPISFALLTGKQVPLSLGVSAGVKIGLPEGLLSNDELGLELGAKASLGIKGDAIYMHLETGADMPRMYQSGFSKTVSDDFLATFREARTEKLRKEIAKWLQDNIVKALDYDTFDRKKEASQKALNEYRKKKAKEKTTDGMQKLLDKLIEKISDDLSLDAKKGINDMLDALTATRGELPDLQTKLEAVRNQLQEAKPDSASSTGASVKWHIVQQRQKRQIAQAKWYLQQIKELTTAPAMAPQPLPERLWGLNFVDLFSYGGQVKAEASASAEAKLSTFGGLDLKAKGSLTGKAALITYRYQTASIGDQGATLVMTQDTIISHRQISAEGKAALDAKLKVKSESESFSREAERGPALYNTMTYTSAVVYWRYPDEFSSKLAGGLPRLQGSGVSFGCSVLLKRLQKYKNDDELVNTLAKSLNVKPASLKYFLSTVKPEEIDPGEIGSAQALLLESNFGFPAPHPQRLRDGRLPIQVLNGLTKDGRKLTGYKLADDLLGQIDVKAFITRLKTQQEEPDTIRLRIRTTDANQHTRSKFSLGYVLKAQYSHEEHSGLDGAFDLRTEWFGDSAKYNNQRLDGHEVTVPPVALLYQ